MDWCINYVDQRPPKIYAVYSINTILILILLMDFRYWKFRQNNAINERTVQKWYAVKCINSCKCKTNDIENWAHRWTVIIQTLPYTCIPWESFINLDERHDKQQQQRPTCSEWPMPSTSFVITLFTNTINPLARIATSDEKLYRYINVTNRKQWLRSNRKEILLWKLNCIQVRHCYPFCGTIKESLTLSSFPGMSL